MRGDVSIFRGGAGGISYFSNGSVKGGLRMGASFCPETLVSDNIQIRPRNRVVVEAVENLIVLLKSWSFKVEAIHGI